MFEKRCSKCGEIKALTEYYADKGCRDGCRPDCKVCNLAAKAARHAANPEPGRERAKRWNQENPERYMARMDAYRKSGKKKVADRKSHLKRTFGITPEDYDLMLAEQGGGCAICERPPRDDIALHVDHDHRTGLIRGLLCFRCNNAVGDLDNDPEVASALAGYLVAFQEQLVRERLRQLKAG